MSLEDQHYSQQQKIFLDDLNLSKLSDLPELPEIQNIPEEAQISRLNEPPPSKSE